MVNLENLKTRLDNDVVDQDELLTALIETVEALADRMDGETSLSVESIEVVLTDCLEDYLTEPMTCEFQIYRATLESPAEYCENYAAQGSEFCKDHN